MVTYEVREVSTVLPQVVLQMGRYPAAEVAVPMSVLAAAGVPPMEVVLAGSEVVLAVVLAGSEVVQAEVLEP
jgi:hypothetical protein